MNRRPLLRAVLLAAVAVTLAADFDEKNWRYRKPLAAAAGSEAAEILLDREVFLGAREDLADLRVIRGGAEVPYVLDTLQPLGAIETTVDGEVTDKAYRPGVGLELVVRTAGRPGHDRARLQTRRRNFRANVRIEASDNGAGWVLLRENAPIFDFTDGDRSYSSLVLRYPRSTRPYLRLTVKGWSDPDDISGVSVAQSVERQGESVTAAEARPGAREDARLRATEYQMDLGGTGIPQDRARFAVDGGPFHRAVEVETSRDGERWSRQGGGVLFRVEGEESLEVSFPETRGRYLRFRVFHGDDAPLDVRGIHVGGAARRLRFPGGSDAWLYFGNPRARKPEYDFGRILAGQAVSARRVEAGGQQQAPAYVPPPPPRKPWTEEHPALLWVVLLGAVAVLGGAAFRILLRPAPGARKP